MMEKHIIVKSDTKISLEGIKEKFKFKSLNAVIQLLLISWGETR